MRRISFREVVEPYSELQPLDETQLPDDPLDLFIQWAREALATTPMAHAVCLSTANAGASPSGRIVLVKDVDEQGLTFYTNYQSRKGQDLTQNPRAALTFFWMPLYRQVRVEGPVSRLSDEENDAYFARRPRPSQVAAWASAQSQPVANRQELEQRFWEEWQRWQDKPVPRPPYWGGYRLQPMRWEFWQGHPSRLHDRIEYLRTAEGQWTRRRLFP